MALKSSKTLSSTAQIVTSSQAFMPSHLFPCWDHFWLFVLLDLKLNCPAIIPHRTEPLPSPAHPPPHRLLFSCPIPSTPPPPRTSSGPSTHPELQLLDSRLCTATLSSRPLPAARLLIGIGGEERIAVRHGCPLEPTEPGQGHPHHSWATTAHSKHGRRRERGMRELQEREITLLLSST